MSRFGTLLILAALIGCRSTGRAPLEAEGEGSRPGYEVRFSGNETFSDGRLREVIADELAEFELDGPTRPEADDAAYSIEEFHRNEGFHEALVTYDYEAEEGEKVRIGFEIHEGPRAVIDKVELSGELHYDRETIEEAIAGSRGGLLGNGERYFVRSKVIAGANSLRDFYFSEGYLQIRVSDPQITFDDSKEKVTVRVQIETGPKYRVTKVELEGDLGQWREKVEALAKDFIGRPFTPRVPYSLRAQIIESYASRGFPDTKVTFQDERDATTGAVELHFSVVPGERVTIKAVEFEGQDRTKRSFLASRVKLKKGDRYDSEAIRESFRGLYRTGLFESVRMELVEDEGSERTLRVIVEEAPAIELSIEPGYGSYEGPRLSLGAEYKNFLGTAKNTHIETTVSTKAYGAIAGIRDPFLFGSEFTGNADLIYSNRQEPSFTSESIGTTLSVSRQWTRKWRNSLAYTYRKENVTNVKADDPDAQDELDNVDISSIALTTTRDNLGGEIFFPRSGSRTRLTLEWADSAIGSELDFQRLRFDEANYFSLGEESVLALSLRTGVIRPTDGTDVIPIQERFFNGGENTVRSFMESELGPVDDDNEPLGGEAWTVLTAELRRHLVGNFSGALFYDTGNVVQDYTDYFHFDGFRSGIGVGVRYMLPIGPLRLDVADNPNPKDGEDQVVAHFAIGMSF